MNDSAHDYLPIAIASAILIGDLIGATAVFFILKNRGHALAFVIPGLILLSGVIAAVLVYFFLSR